MNEIEAYLARKNIHPSPFSGKGFWLKDDVQTVLAAHSEGISAEGIARELGFGSDPKDRSGYWAVSSAVGMLAGRKHPSTCSKPKNGETVYFRC